MAESIEFRWTESGVEFIEGRGWVPYTRVVEPKQLGANDSLFLASDSVADVRMRCGPVIAIGAANE